MTDRLDPSVIATTAGSLALFIDSDSSCPVTIGLRTVLEAPLHPSQVLNTAIALANVAGLVALSLSRDEQTAPDLVEGSIARTAAELHPEITNGADGDLSRPVHALINRLFDTASADDVPDEIDGPLLAALASYADAGVLIADQVGIPREVLAVAVSQAAADL